MSTLPTAYGWVRAAGVASLMLLCQAASATPITWNATTDFSTTNSTNVNGVWSYGSTGASLTGAFTSYATPLRAGTYYYWQDGASQPSMGKAIGGHAQNVPNNTLDIHPGMNGEYAVLRFLATNSGQYSVDAAFWANSVQTTTDIHILADGVQQFSGAVLASAPHLNPSWTGTLTMTAGDFIDIAVGRGSDSWVGDSTGFSAIISYIGPGSPSSDLPEPGSAVLLISGVALLAARLRRRTKA